MKVGLLDADVYGPNVPNHDEARQNARNKKMVPIESYGVKCMSMGLLVAKDASLVWRGPMVSSALEQMTRGVDWEILMFFVVDMPPGTGDAHITVSQRLQLSDTIRSGDKTRLDDGVPIVISAPDSDVSKAYVDMAQKVVDRLEELSKEEQSRPQFNL
ncbi:Iiron-sulfur protein required for NADH dehydrogenase-like protein [Prunus dulcis]|uniref:Iiron-sulfur protein required for NADH dehydrogenase-like protein n=1 Tax=Prunus dulcis TaxID=3755 RepID=A0A4Y1S239_PRUDU|nr:Iiron-sulfur protein required for NADH dehydrogenase-like protein [Prunus dulcis]